VVGGNRTLENTLGHHHSFEGGVKERAISTERKGRGRRSSEKGKPLECSKRKKTEWKRQLPLLFCLARKKEEIGEDEGTVNFPMGTGHQIRDRVRRIVPLSGSAQQRALLSEDKKGRRVVPDLGTEGRGQKGGCDPYARHLMAKTCVGTGAGRKSRLAGRGTKRGGG